MVNIPIRINFRERNISDLQLRIQLLEEFCIELLQSYLEYPWGSGNPDSVLQGILKTRLLDSPLMKEDSYLIGKIRSFNRNYVTNSDDIDKLMDEEGWGINPSLAEEAASPITVLSRMEEINQEANSARNPHLAWTSEMKREWQMLREYRDQGLDWCEYDPATQTVLAPPGSKIE